MKFRSWQGVFRFALIVAAGITLAACNGGSGGAGSGGGGGGGGGGTPAPTETSINAVGFITGMLVRVGGAFTSTTNHIEYSTNGGSTWTAATGCPGGMNAVQYFFAQSLWVAVGGLYDPAKSKSVPQICESADGMTWTVNGDSNFSAYGKSTFVALMVDADAIALGRSADGSECLETYFDFVGASWSAASDCTGIPNPPHAVTVAASTFFVAGGPSPGIAYFYSGGSWTTALASPGTTAIERFWDGINLWIVAGTAGGQVYAAPDQMTYSLQAEPTSEAILDIESNFIDTVVAVGTGGLLMSSTDVANWTVESSGTTEHLRGVAWDGDNSRYVIVGDGGSTFTY